MVCKRFAPLWLLIATVAGIRERNSILTQPADLIEDRGSDTAAAAFVEEQSAAHIEGVTLTDKDAQGDETHPMETLSAEEGELQSKFKAMGINMPTDVPTDYLKFLPLIVKKLEEVKEAATDTDSISAEPKYLKSIVEKLEEVNSDSITMEEADKDSITLEPFINKEGSFWFPMSAVVHTEPNQKPFVYLFNRKALHQWWELHNTNPVVPRRTMSDNDAVVDVIPQGQELEERDKLNLERRDSVTGEPLEPVPGRPGYFYVQGDDGRLQQGPDHPRPDRDALVPDQVAQLSGFAGVRPPEVTQILWVRAGLVIVGVGAGGLLTGVLVLGLRLLST